MDREDVRAVMVRSWCVASCRISEAVKELE